MRATLAAAGPPSGIEAEVTRRERSYDDYVEHARFGRGISAVGGDRRRIEAVRKTRVRKHDVEGHHPIGLTVGEEILGAERAAEVTAEGRIAADVLHDDPAASGNL